MVLVNSFRILPPGNPSFPRLQSVQESRDLGRAGDLQGGEPGSSVGFRNWGRFAAGVQGLGEDFRIGGDLQGGSREFGRISDLGRICSRSPGT